MQKSNGNVAERGGLRFAAAAMAASALALFGAAAAYAQAPASAEPLRVGVIISTTGGLAGAGIPEREGLLLAQKSLNERGGIKGRKLELVIEDDNSSPDVAITKANALVHQHKVRALLGASGIGQTVAVGGISAPLNLPQIAMSGLGPAVERERTCLFHAPPAQELNARSILSYARDAKLKNIAVLHDSGFGQVIWNVLKNLTAEYGVTFVHVEKFELGANDATTQAAKIKAANPEAVFVIGTSAVPFRNLRQVKVEVPIISTFPTATYDYVKTMGSAADNVIHAEFVVAEDPQPYQKEFVELYKKEYGKLPKHFEAMGWDVLMMMARAFETAGVDAPNDVLCQALRRPHQGVMTHYDFSAADLSGIALSGFSFSKLVNGQFTRLDYRIAK